MSEGARSLWRALAAILAGVALLLLLVGTLVWRALDRQGLLDAPADWTAPELPQALAADTGSDPEARAPAPEGESVLHVQVEDEQGRAAPGVPMKIWDEDTEEVLVEAVSGAEGQASLTLPRPTRIAVLGAKGWILTGEGNELVLDQPEQQTTVVAIWPCRVDIQVFAPDGAPLAGGRVSLESDEGTGSILNPWTTLDDEGRGRKGLLRCYPARLRVRGPAGESPRRFWELPIKMVAGESLLIELTEDMQPREPPPAPLRALALTLDCVDCPAWLACRTAPDPEVRSGYGEHPCEGGPKQWRCECPVAPLSIWGTWLNPLTEDGSGEPLGRVPADVEAWTLEVSELFGSVEARWEGERPCRWALLVDQRHHVGGDCDGAGGLGIDGLRPGAYTLELRWGEFRKEDRVSWDFEIQPGQDEDLGALSP